MTLHRFSRRRLLGGWLAGLAAWLCPRPSRAAAPHLSTPAPYAPVDPFAPSITYIYDGDTLTVITSYAYDGSCKLNCTSYDGADGRYFIK